MPIYHYAYLSLDLTYDLSYLSDISCLWSLTSQIYDLWYLWYIKFWPWTIPLNLGTLLFWSLIILTYKIFSVNICQIFLQRSSSNLQHLSPYDHQHSLCNSSCQSTTESKKGFINRWHSTSLLLLHFVHVNPLWANMFLADTILSFTSCLAFKKQ